MHFGVLTGRETAQLLLQMCSAESTYGTEGQDSAANKPSPHSGQRNRRGEQEKYFAFVMSGVHYSPDVREARLPLLWVCPLDFIQRATMRLKGFTSKQCCCCVPNAIRTTKKKKKCVWTKFHSHGTFWQLLFHHAALKNLGLYLLTVMPLQIIWLLKE